MNTRSRNGLYNTIREMEADIATHNSKPEEMLYKALETRLNKNLLNSAELMDIINNSDSKMLSIVQMLGRINGEKFNKGF